MTMVTVKLTVNGKAQTIEADGDMPLLWALRDDLGLTAAKYGCGAGLCGACTVHLDGAALRACITTLAEAEGKQVTTLEAYAGAHPVQAAWIAEDVPQCGYCQPGMIMAAAALLAENPKPDDAAIDAAITNICRCGSYPRVRKAIARAALSLDHRSKGETQ
jgi:isoquinoline 1-oxidoreductase subunit alpha